MKTIKYLDNILFVSLPKSLTEYVRGFEHFCNAIDPFFYFCYYGLRGFELEWEVH